MYLEAKCSVLYILLNETGALIWFYICKQLLLVLTFANFILFIT